MEENKKITKKQIITMSIGVGLLIVLVIGATYAFFIFGNSNIFRTSKLTASTPTTDTGSVLLENINTTLTLELSIEDMVLGKGNTTYWASAEGKKTSETINEIGRFKAVVDGTYTCSYTMTIEDKAEKNLYEAFSNFSEKSNNQIKIKINEEEYDYNENNLFPITYHGIAEGITQSDYQYIRASMYIKNELNIDQTDLADKEVELEFKVTELSCTNNEFLPEITNFEIGGRETLNSRNTIIYLGWDSESIESYCISKSDKVNTCTWENTESNKGEVIDYTIEGNVGDNITLYAYIKDSDGNIGRASDTVTLGEIQSGANYIISLADQANTNVITQTHDTGTSGTVQTGHNTDTDYRYIGNGQCSYDNGNYIGGEVNGKCPKLYNYISTKISDNTTTNLEYYGYIPLGNNEFIYTKTAEFEGTKINDNSPYNYVCLGKLKNNGSCESEDKLYRIIGVMPTQTTKNGVYENRIKLIKSTEYLDDDKLESTYTLSGYGYYWTGQRENGIDKYTSYGGAESNLNNWEESTLNRVVLNQTYYNSLEAKYQNMIGNSVWYLGGRGSVSAPVTTFYNAERSDNVKIDGSKINPIYVERKIGLMYASDYGFATSGDNEIPRETCLVTNMVDWNSFRNCYNKDWLLISHSIQWTINPRSDKGEAALNIYFNGTLHSLNIYEKQFIIRPTFYLNTNVNIISGNGSISTPYTLGQ